MCDYTQRTSLKGDLMEAKNLEAVEITPDVFDTTNTSDLPDDVVDQIKTKSTGRGSGDHRRMVEALISAAENSPLSFEQIVVGLYRAYGVTEERKALRPKLKRYVKSGALFETPEGRYRLATTDESIAARAAQREENRKRAARKAAGNAKVPEPSPNEGDQDPPW